MSFAMMAAMFRQAIPLIQAQGDILRSQYYLLSDQMDSLAQGTTGWEGQASAVCEQLWEDLGPKLILQVAALNDLSDALSSVASEFEHIADNPSQAAADMGLPVAGVSLGSEALEDGLLGAIALPVAIVATAVVAGVVMYVTEQQEEQNALTATQQVVAFKTTSAPGSVEEATREVPPLENPTDEGGQGNPSPNSPKWPYYAIGILAVGGIGAFIVLHLTPAQQQQAHDIATKYGVSVTDVQRLLGAGFTEEQIVKLLQAGYTTSDMVILITAGCTPAQVVSYEAAGIPSSAITTVCQRIQQAQASPTGKDQYGVAASDWSPILDRLARLLVRASTETNKSSARGLRLEATTVINELPILVNAGEVPRDSNNSPITDVDIETPCAIIEVTRQSGGKIDQITTLQNDMRVNPLHKQVVLFAPKYTSDATKDITALGVPVIKTQTDLDNYLRNLKCNNPGGGN